VITFCGYTEPNPAKEAAKGLDDDFNKKGKVVKK
jgi:hypothetical protein